MPGAPNAAAVGQPGLPQAHAGRPHIAAIAAEKGTKTPQIADPMPYVFVKRGMLSERRAQNAQRDRSPLLDS